MIDIKEYVNTEELKRLLSTLVVILVAIIIFILFAFIVVPGIRNANRPRTAPSGSPQIGEMGWVDPVEFPPSRKYKIPPLDPKTVMESTPELVEKGKALFEKECIQCHGKEGKGDGPAASSTNPHPRNFTKAEGWKNGYGLPAIYKTLTGGIQGSSMNSFDYLKKQDRMALAHYVQSLMPFSRGPEDPEAMKKLSQELGSAGETVPNKIPASMAMARLEKEFKAPAALSLPGGDDRSEKAEILRRAIVDPARAARTLSGSTAWRKGTRELARLVLGEAPANGFSITAAELSSSQWQLLLSELIKQ